MLMMASTVKHGIDRLRKGNQRRLPIYLYTYKFARINLLYFGLSASVVILVSILLHSIESRLAGSKLV